MQVYMWTDVSLSMACEFDYSTYPNDVHKCCVQLDDKRFFAVRSEQTSVLSICNFLSVYTSFR